MKVLVFWFLVNLQVVRMNLRCSSFSPLLIKKATLNPSETSESCQSVKQRGLIDLFID